MADSYRLAVLKRLTTLLEGTIVTPVAGITLPATLTGVVFRGRNRFGDNDPDTMLALLESPRQGGASFTDDDQVRNEDWGLLIQGMCPELKTHPCDSTYSLLDDVERRLDRITKVTTETGFPKYPSDYMLGPSLDGDGHLITRFRVSAGTVRPPTENISSRSFFYIPVQVGLARIHV